MRLGGGRRSGVNSSTSLFEKTLAWCVTEGRGQDGGGRGRRGNQRVSWIEGGVRGDTGEIVSQNGGEREERGRSSHPAIKLNRGNHWRRVQRSTKSAATRTSPSSQSGSNYHPADRGCLTPPRNVLKGSGRFRMRNMCGCRTT